MYKNPLNSHDVNLNDYWENKLSSEGLGDLDNTEGFLQTSSTISSYKRKLNNIIEIEKQKERLEDEYQVRIDVDTRFQEVKIFNQIGTLIGRFRSSHFSKGNIFLDNHIEKYVEEEFRGKGLGNLLNEVWGNYNFPKPNIEASSKANNILFLINIGYDIVGYYDDNGEAQELTYEEIIILEKQLNNLKKSNEDLDFVYQLKLRK